VRGRGRAFAHPTRSDALRFCQGKYFSSRTKASPCRCPVRAQKSFDNKAFSGISAVPCAIEGAVRLLIYRAHPSH